MRRWAVAVLSLLALLGISGAVPAFAAEPKDPNPLNDSFSPIAWKGTWATGTTNRDALSAVELKSKYEQVGFVIYVGGTQWGALTATDRTALQTAWDDHLLDNVISKGTRWQTVAFQDVAAVPMWSDADSNEVAKWLGGTSYADLSPGLKSVLQRIATIITGDARPPMPDAEWSNWMTADIRDAYGNRADRRFDWSSATLIVDGSDSVITTCDAGPLLNWACEATRAVADGVSATVSFLTDPLGWLTGKVGEGATAILGWIAGVANEATTPDITAQWWIDAYTKGMAVGLVLFGMLLIWQFIQRARNKITPEEFMEVLWYRVPAFFAGLVFGPPLANFFIVGASNLADGVIESMFGSGAQDSLAAMQTATEAASAGEVIGGFFVALFFLILVLIAAVMIFISLAVQQATVYMASVVFAVAFAWIVSARHGRGSFKIPFLVLGLAFARPLLFFMLGIGTAIVRSAIGMEGDNLAENLATLIMAVVVLAMAGFAPLLLLKFAPVMPQGMEESTSGPGSGGHSAHGRPGGGGGSRLNGLTSRPGPGSGSGRGGSGGGGRAGRVAAGVSGAAAGAARGAASGTSRAGRRSGGGGSVLASLQRSRRHGGGTPSAGAQRVAAAQRAARSGGPASSGSSSGGAGGFRGAAGRAGRAVGRGGRAMGRGARAAGRGGRAVVGAGQKAGGAVSRATGPARRGAQGLAGGVGGDRPWGDE